MYDYAKLSDVTQRVGETAFAGISKELESKDKLGHSITQDYLKSGNDKWLQKFYDDNKNKKDLDLKHIGMNKLIEKIYSQEEYDNGAFFNPVSFKPKEVFGNLKNALTKRLHLHSRVGSKICEGYADKLGDIYLALRYARKVDWKSSDQFLDLFNIFKTYLNAILSKSSDMETIRKLAKILVKRAENYVTFKTVNDETHKIKLRERLLGNNGYLTPDKLDILEENDQKDEKKFTERYRGVNTILKLDTCHNIIYSTNKFFEYDREVTDESNEYTYYDKDEDKRILQTYQNDIDDSFDGIVPTYFEEKYEDENAEEKYEDENAEEKYEDENANENDDSFLSSDETPVFDDKEEYTFAGKFINKVLKISKNDLNAAPNMNIKLFINLHCSNFSVRNFEEIVKFDAPCKSKFHDKNLKKTFSIVAKFYKSGIVSMQQILEWFSEAENISVLKDSADKYWGGVKDKGIDFFKSLRKSGNSQNNIKDAFISASLKLIATTFLKSKGGSIVCEDSYKLYSFCSFILHFSEALEEECNKRKDENS